MNANTFRFSLASLIVAVVISAFLFAFGPVAILLGTPCLLIFGSVRAVRNPGRVRVFWIGFLLVGAPLFFAAWLPAPAPYNKLINYLMFLSVETVADVIPDRPGVEPGTVLDVGISAVVSSFWLSVPLLLGLASGKLAVWLVGDSSPNEAAAAAGWLGLSPRSPGRGIEDSATDTHPDRRNLDRIATSDL